MNGPTSLAFSIFAFIELWVQTDFLSAYLILYLFTDILSEFACLDKVLLVQHVQILQILLIPINLQTEKNGASRYTSSENISLVQISIGCYLEYAECGLFLIRTSILTQWWLFSGILPPQLNEITAKMKDLPNSLKSSVGEVTEKCTVMWYRLLRVLPTPTSPPNHSLCKSHQIRSVSSVVTKNAESAVPVCKNC